MWHFDMTLPSSIRECACTRKQPSEKSVPSVMRERSFGQDVNELAFGVTIFYLDHWVKVKPVRQPFKFPSVGAGCVPHCRASSFDDQLELHCPQRCTIGRFSGTHIRKNLINFFQTETLRRKTFLIHSTERLFVARYIPHVALD